MSRGRAFALEQDDCAFSGWLGKNFPVLLG
jgi:hypothetical protein